MSKFRMVRWSRTRRTLASTAKAQAHGLTGAPHGEPEIGAEEHEGHHQPSSASGEARGRTGSVQKVASAGHCSRRGCRPSCQPRNDEQDHSNTNPGRDDHRHSRGAASYPFGPGRIRPAGERFPSPASAREPSRGGGLSAAMLLVAVFLRGGLRSGLRRCRPDRRQHALGSARPFARLWTVDLSPGSNRRTAACTTGLCSCCPSGWTGRSPGLSTTWAHCTRRLAPRRGWRWGTRPTRGRAPAAVAAPLRASSPDRTAAVCCGARRRRRWASSSQPASRACRAGAAPLGALAVAAPCSTRRRLPWRRRRGPAGVGVQPRPAACQLAAGWSAASVGAAVVARAAAGWACRQGLEATPSQRRSGRA